MRNGSQPMVADGQHGQHRLNEHRKRQISTIKAIIVDLSEFEISNPFEFGWVRYK